MTAISAPRLLLLVLVIAAATLIWGIAVGFLGAAVQVVAGPVWALLVVAAIATLSAFALMRLILTEEAFDA